MKEVKNNPEAHEMPNIQRRQVRDVIKGQYVEELSRRTDTLRSKDAQKDFYGQDNPFSQALEALSDKSTDDYSKAFIAYMAKLHAKETEDMNNIAKAKKTVDDWINRYSS